MKELPKTAIFMDDEAAAQYVTMLKYWHVIKVLDEHDFYDLRNGSMELHKDRIGNLSTVIKHEHSFLTRHD